MALVQKLSMLFGKKPVRRKTLQEYQQEVLIRQAEKQFRQMMRLGSRMPVTLL